MRFYQDFPEAINEIKRELKEMGVRVKTKSVQNLDITNRPEYDSYELQNYIYQITSPTFTSIPLKNQAWAEAEFYERTHPTNNPGKAWELMREYWGRFLNRQMMFDYFYSDRMQYPLDDAIKALKKDINTRRAFISIFNPEVDDPEEFGCRIPCSLGYWFNYRQGQLNITYLQRSCDFFNHYNYDLYFADRLKHYVATEVGVAPGNLCHWVGSLHCFMKDVEGIF